MAKYTVLALLVFVAAIAQADIFSYRAPDGSIVFTDEPKKGSKTVIVEEPMVVPAMKKKREKPYKWPSESEPMWPEPEATTLPRSAAPRSGEDIPAYDNSANTSWSSETQGIESSTYRPKKKRASDFDASSGSGFDGATATSEKPRRPPVKNYRKLRVISPTAGSSQWVGGELTIELKLQPSLQSNHVVSLRVDGREVAVGPNLRHVVPNISRGSHTVRAAVLDVDTGKQLIVSSNVRFQIHRASKNKSSKMLHPSVGN